MKTFIAFILSLFKAKPTIVLDVPFIYSKDWSIASLSSDELKAVTILDVVATQLKKRGYKVIKAYEFNVRNVIQKTKQINELSLQNPVYISYMLNLPKNLKDEGVEVYTTVGETLSDNIALEFAYHYKKQFPKKSLKGIKERDYYILKFVNMLSIAVTETGYSDNVDYRWFINAVKFLKK